MNIRGLILHPLAILAVASQSAFAAIQLDEFGTFTTTAWGDCAAPCNLTDVSFTTLVGPETGGQGVLSTSNSLDTVDTGGAGDLFAESTLVGGSTTPVLRASAVSNPGRYVSTQATAAQGFTVIGGGIGQTFDFDITLSGTVNNPGGDGSGLAGTVGIAKVENPGDFLFSQIALLALFDLDAARLEILSGSVPDSGTVSVTADEGEQFYVWALLGASAGDAASAISTSTLSIELPWNAENLDAAAVVPVPPAIILLLSALGFLGFRFRAGATV